MVKKILFTLLAAFTASCYIDCQPRLFMHTDKAIYNGNETIWFAAYELDTIPIKRIDKLFISLTDCRTDSVIYSKKCIMANGFSWGDVFLPDTLSGAKYILRAYTEHSIRSSVFFSQYIRIRGQNVVDNKTVFVKNAPQNDSTVPGLPFASLVVDSPVCHRRTKVTVHLKVRDSLHTGKAYFSAAVVAKGRLDTLNVPNIIRYFQHAPAQTELPQLQLPASFEETGAVLIDGKPPRKRNQLLISGDNGTSTLSTTAQGTFVVPDSILYSIGPSKIIASVTGSNINKGCKLTVSQPEQVINKQLAKTCYTFYKPAIADRSGEQGDDGEDNTPSSMLSTVTVRTKLHKPDDEDLIYNREYNSYNCDEDYVCGICGAGNDQFPPFMNCGVHPGMGQKPVEGQRYSILINKEGRYAGSIVVVYHCREQRLNPYITLLDPIFIGSNFPVYNPSTVRDAFPKKNTTVYWNPFIQLDSKGEADIEFYTNDLAGDFYINVNGVAGNQPFTASTRYRVLP